MLTSAAALGAMLIAPQASAQNTPAIDLLSALPTAAEATIAYSRDYFQHWIDADGDGCDTRAEVLMIESSVPTTGGCPVKGGNWTSYYDGAVWTLASDVDIDHMVPLAEAWRSGAWAWTPDMRLEYANDLSYGPALVAVTDNVNQSKGDRDPAEWLPPSGAATCQYVADWVGVKYRWGLSVDTTERTTLQNLLTGSCTGATPSQVPERIGGRPVAQIEAYVTKVYNDLFERTPDTVGLEGWTRALANYTPPGEVANGITYSDEYRLRLITASYNTYLSRGPDPAGAAGWLDAMKRGLTIQQMEGGFIASDEYYAKAGGTNAGWVGQLYQHVLGRPGAAEEIDAWTRALARGESRYQVAMGFLISFEHLTDVVEAHYQHLLGRGIDPEGNQGWVLAIQRGTRVEAVIAGIVASDEYWSKVPVP